jgi:hypothetical protein
MPLIPAGPRKKAPEVSGLTSGVFSQVGLTYFFFFFAAFFVAKSPHLPSESLTRTLSRLHRMRELLRHQLKSVWTDFAETFIALE